MHLENLLKWTRIFDVNKTVEEKTATQLLHARSSFTSPILMTLILITSLPALHHGDLRTTSSITTPTTPTTTGRLPRS